MWLSLKRDNDVPVPGSDWTTALKCQSKSTCSMYFGLAQTVLIKPPAIFPGRVRNYWTVILVFAFSIHGIGELKDAK